MDEDTEDSTREAMDTVVDAFRSIGLDATDEGGVLIILPDGPGLRVHSAAVARPDFIGRVIARSPGPGPGLVVADQIPAVSRQVLDGAGWAWLDRRGHLKLRHGSIWIDTDVPPAPRMTARGAVDPVGGAVAIGVGAAALRSSPEPLAGIRPTARLIGASPSAVSEVLTRLSEAGLITRDLRSIDPDLFWAVAARFPTSAVGVRGAIPIDRDDVVAVGTRAAASLGVMPATADYPLELLARDEAAARSVARAISRGRAPGSSETIRIITSPSPFLASEPLLTTVDGVAVAHPHTVAMSLAVDLERGAEALDGWEHPDRVW